MLEESLILRIVNDTGRLLQAQLLIYEEDPDNRDCVKIELISSNWRFNSSEDNYFNALIKLREVLESHNMQILCKGANKNVYPSAMQLNMGIGRYAYKLTLNQRASQKEVVDIFEPSTVKECVSIKEQKQFFELWIESLGR